MINGRQFTPYLERGKGKVLRREIGCNNKYRVEGVRLLNGQNAAIMSYYRSILHDRAIVCVAMLILEPHINKLPFLPCSHFPG